MKKTTRRKITVAITIVAIIIIAASAKFAIQYYTTRVRQIHLKETAYIYITPQDDSESVLNKIEEIIAPASAEGFAILSKHNNYNNKRRSGKFAIKDGDTMKDIYYRIVSNTQTPVKLVVP